MILTPCPYGPIKMPSFPAGVKKTQFVWFGENQGKFNVSNMVDVVLADNTFDVPGLDVHHLCAPASRFIRAPAST